MALVECPECAARISSNAPQCPSCGNPMSQSGIRAGKLNPKHTGQVVAIERTGKGIKAHGCLSVLALTVGVVLLVITFAMKNANPNADTTTLTVWGAILTAVSLPWMLYARVAKWWRHA